MKTDKILNRLGILPSENAALYTIAEKYDHATGMATKAYQDAIEARVIFPPTVAGGYAVSTFRDLVTEMGRWTDRSAALQMIFHDAVAAHLGTDLPDAANRIAKACGE